MKAFFVFNILFPNLPVLKIVYLNDLTQAYNDLKYCI